MQFETYAERPLTESVACDVVTAVATSVVTSVAARALMSEQDGVRGLSPLRTLTVAAIGWTASWAVYASMRRVFSRFNR